MPAIDNCRPLLNVKAVSKYITWILSSGVTCPTIHYPFLDSIVFLLKAMTEIKRCLSETLLGVLCWKLACVPHTPLSVKSHTHTYNERDALNSFSKGDKSRIRRRRELFCTLMGWLHAWVIYIYIYIIYSTCMHDATITSSINFFFCWDNLIN